MKSSNSIDAVHSLMMSFLYGDVWWARIRLFFLIGIMDIIAAGMAVMFEVIAWIRIWHDVFFPSLLLLGAILIGVPILRDIKELDKSDSKAGIRMFGLIVFIALFAWVESRLIERMGLPGPYIGHYLLTPLAGLVGAILASARYIQNIYSLESYSIALLYLLSSFWGVAYPQLTISGDQRQIALDKVNRLDVIGGPGYITIPRGNAVIVHDEPNNSTVCSGQTFFIKRFTSISPTVYLDDQRGSVSDVSATTKDGITITVRDIELRYRIWSPTPIDNGVHSARNRINPYPYTVQAVKDSVYNLSVTDKGVTPWFDMVKIVVTGRITDYIAERQFDQIVTPNYEQGDPRKQIHDQLFTQETQNRLKEMGAQLLWCDIGHFEADKAVLEQHLETWSAKWIGSANVIRAHGEAQRIAYQELGRAEAQADMLTSIIHAFDDIDLSKEKKDQNIRNVILMRTAQVLDALTETMKPLVTYKKTPSELSDDNINKEEKQS